VITAEELTKQRGGRAVVSDGALPAPVYDGGEVVANSPCFAESGRSSGENRSKNVPLGLCPLACY